MWFLLIFPLYARLLAWDTYQIPHQHTTGNTLFCSLISIVLDKLCKDKWFGLNGSRKTRMIVILSWIWLRFLVRFPSRCLKFVTFFRSFTWQSCNEFVLYSYEIYTLHDLCSVLLCYKIMYSGKSSRIFRKNVPFSSSSHK